MKSEKSKLVQTLIAKAKAQSHEVGLNIKTEKCYLASPFSYLLMMIGQFVDYGVRSVELLHKEQAYHLVREGHL